MLRKAVSREELYNEWVRHGASVDISVSYLPSSSGQWIFRLAFPSHPASSRTHQPNCEEQAHTHHTPLPNPPHPSPRQPGAPVLPVGSELHPIGTCSASDPTGKGGGPTTVQVATVQMGLSVLQMRKLRQARSWRQGGNWHPSPPTTGPLPVGPSRPMFHLPSPHPTSQSHHSRTAWN